MGVLLLQCIRLIEFYDFRTSIFGFLYPSGTGGEIEQQIMEQEIRDRMPEPQYANKLKSTPKIFGISEELLSLLFLDTWIRGAY